MKARNWTAIGLLISFIVIFVGWLSVFVYFGKSYIISLPAAILFIAFSVIILINRKRLSTPIFRKQLPIYSVFWLISGLLFFASSIIDFGYGAFAENMSIQEQPNFFRVLRPEQISFGFVECGLGVLLFWGGLSNLKDKVSSEASAQNQKDKKIFIFTLCSGIFCFVYGIHSVIMGLYP